MVLFPNQPLPKEIEGEIDEIKKISAKELISELKINVQSYCPWMLIALELLDKSDQRDT